MSGNQPQANQQVDQSATAPTDHQIITHETDMSVNHPQGSQQVTLPASAPLTIEHHETNVSGNLRQAGRDLHTSNYTLGEGAHLHVHGASGENLQEGLHGMQHLQPYPETAEESSFDLELCQQELISFYQQKMGQVQLLPWFDETRDMEDIYVNLELENKRKVLSSNEDLVTIKTSRGTLAKRILVKGLVGSGKSTLMAKLAYTWAQRKPISPGPLYKYELVFILSFREIKSECRLIDAIFQQILADDTKVSKTGLETYIHSNSNILFLMDGFDEYVANTLDKIQGDIDAMLNIKILRNTCVIVSSRSHKHLGSCQTFYESVNLTGFSTQNVTLYLTKFFDNNSELVEGLSRKLSESDMLKSLSHIPIMLMLMCLLWEDAQSLPTTQSELYAEFTQFLWRKCCHRYNTGNPDDDESLNTFLCSLGKVALSGLMPKGDLSQEKLVFREKDFQQEFERGCQVGLLTRERLRSKLTVSSAVTFLHKSFQEYCAAYYWASLFDDQDQFNSILSRIDSEDLVANKLEILKFCCGMREIGAARTIQHVIGIYMTEIGHDTDVYMGIKSVTIVGESSKNIEPVLILLFESNFPCDNADFTDCVQSILSAGKRLVITVENQVVPMWHAFVTSPLASSALNQVKSIEFDELPSLSMDVISETLIHMPDVEEVDIHSRDTGAPDPDSMNRLGDCMGRLKRLSTLHVNCIVDITAFLYHMSVSSEIQLKHMGFRAIICDGDTMSQLLAKQHKLNTLELEDIKLSNGSMESLLDAITAPLVELDLEGTHVGNAIDHIKHIIPHLQQLGLKYTNLEEDDILTLSKFLPEATNLSILDLTHNNVGKAGMTLAKSLKSCSNLTALHLVRTHLTDAGVTSIAGSFCCLTNLKLLMLNGNPDVGNAGLDAVFHHLHHLPNLTSLYLNASIDSECSALVRDCLTAIGVSIPDETGSIDSECSALVRDCLTAIGMSIPDDDDDDDDDDSGLVEVHIEVYQDAAEISSICHAASKYL